MQQIQVCLAQRSYPIWIGEQLLKDATAFLPLKAGDRALVVTNQTIGPLYLNTVQQTLQAAHIQADTLQLADGEQFKSLTIVNQLFDQLIEQQHGRDTTLIALGGGVIGDLTGFAAACYQRGVRFIQVPTTLLAQVDSSVGGKTAVNHPLAKNMIGAFYQPAKVIIDIDCLQTLPRREFVAGLAEVIKYAILFDAEFFAWLEQNSQHLLSLDKPALSHCIARCCQLKADIVAADEQEQNQRALLNLGHTFGHAIETHQGYGHWLHGEAVAAGMVMAANTAVLRQQLSDSQRQRIKNLLQQVGLPIAGPNDMTANDYLPIMQRDKKNIAGKLRLILPTDIGQAVICADVSTDTLLRAIQTDDR